MQGHQQQENLRYALIVAGGNGTRMQSNIPKQFLLLHGKPILMHTLEAFHRFDTQLTLILVLPAAQINYWKNICRQSHFDLPHSIVAGGETRFQSVKNGLERIPENALVAIHDGVRPFVNINTIARTFDAAVQYGAAVPVVDVVDSIRQIDETGNHAVNRQYYKLVQTPQTFRSNVIKSAYRQPYSPAFTDDASVVEATGQIIHLVEGNRENIKITIPQDLSWAENGH